jgi:hypothetical protein
MPSFAESRLGWRAGAVRGALALVAALAAAAGIPASAPGHATHRDGPAAGGELPVDASALGPRARPRAAGATARTASAAASPWCGTARRTDDRRNAAFGAEPTVKLVYAHPAGRPSRLRHFAPILQANAAVISRFVAEASGGRKTVRFDLGTRCGPQFADIQVVRLRHRASHYRGDDGLPTVEGDAPLRTELRAATRRQRAQKLLVFADGLHPAGPGELTVSGQTDDLPQDSTPGPRNAANRGGNLAVVFGPDRALPPQDADGFESRMFLHELLHTLGAVQEGAPHATVGGHCYDGSDVLCYRDNTARSALYTERACDAIGGAIGQPLDCGGDDYFNPAPEPGSYLARHWNVYDSVFLAACSDARVAAACAIDRGAAPAAAAPRLTAAADVLADGGARLGAATLDLDLSESTVAASASSTPIAVPAGRHRLETCLSVQGGQQSAPWRDCVTEDVEESPARAPETAVELARPSGGGTMVAVEVRLLAPDGRVVAASAPAQIEVPAAG